MRGLLEGGGQEASLARARLLVDRHGRLECARHQETRTGSTVMSLVAHLYDVIAGSVEIDGQDVRTLKRGE